MKLLVLIPEKIAVQKGQALVAIGVLIAFCVHVFVRVYGIDAVDLDQDEVFTWLYSKFLYHAWADTLLDVHPPTHTILMSFWQRIFGDSEVSLRIPSVIFSLLTLLSLIFFSKLIEPEKRTRYIFFVLILFLFLPYEIHLARYARSYTMLVFSATLFAYYFFKYISDQNRRFLILSVLFGSLSMYTHFQAIFFITSLSLAFLLCGSNRSIAWSVLKVFIGIGFVCLPLLPLIPFQTLVGMLINRVSSSKGHVSASDFLLLFSPISVDPETTDACYSHLMDIRFWILFPPAVFAALVAMKSDRLSLTRILPVQLMILIMLLYAIPVKRIHDRSLCILLPPVIIWVSLALAQLKASILRKSAAIWAVGFAILSVVSFPYVHRVGTHWQSAWDEVSDLVSKSKHPAVVVSPSQQILPVLYLMNRGIITAVKCPIWIETPSVLFSPWEKKLDINVSSRVSFGFWSTISNVLLKHDELTDIFLLRVGKVLMTQQKIETGSPIRLLKRFGYLSLYHVRSVDKAWFTLFDADFYLENNPDVAEAGAHPFLHFMNFGAQEGRNPNRMFDINFYRKQTPDIVQTGQNPISHFIERGSEERLNPHPMFNTNEYLIKHPSVMESGENPLVHFLKEQKR